MEIKKLAQQFDFLEKRGFGEATFQLDEAERHPFIEFKGGLRDVRISLRHRWPTVQLVEWENNGAERSPQVIELEPDLAAFPTLTRPRGLAGFLRMFGLSRRDEEADRAHTEAGAQLAKRVRDEYPEFVATN